MTEVAERIEREARTSLLAEVGRSTRYEVSGDVADIKRGHDPLEIRDIESGETFMLEVRALPTGG